MLDRILKTSLVSSLVCTSMMYYSVEAVTAQTISQPAHTVNLDHKVMKISPTSIQDFSAHSQKPGLRVVTKQTNPQQSQLKKPLIPSRNKGGTSPVATKKTASPMSEFDLEAEVPEIDERTNTDRQRVVSLVLPDTRTESKSTSQDDKAQPQAEKEVMPGQDSLEPMQHYRKSLSFTRSGDYTNALKEVNKALRLNPHLIAARFQGALLFQLEGRTAEAGERYRDVLDLDPKYTVAHINLGMCYRKMNELDDAEDEYRQALEQNFYSLPAHYNLATVLIQKADLDGAMKELKSCARLAPENAPVHNNLGVVYEKCHYLKQAEAEYLKAATLDKANKLFGRNLEIARYKLKRVSVEAVRVTTIESADSFRILARMRPNFA